MTPNLIAYIESRFTSTMSAKYGAALPLYYSNVHVPDTVNSFAVIHVLADSSASPIRIGTKARSRNVGIIQIDVFTPKDHGAGDGKRIAAFAAGQFARHQAEVGGEGHVVFRDPTIQDRGEVRGRHKEMVSIPYRYDFDLSVAYG